MAQRICTIPGCNKKHYGHGWCGMHYRRWQRHGDPATTLQVRLTGNLEDDLLARIDKNGPVPEHRPDLGPCWLWTGNGDGHGYGKIHVDGRQQKAYRVTFQLWSGPVPEGLQIDHLCRVRICVNPSHLEAVTQRENIMRGEGVAVRAMRGQPMGWAGRNKARTHCPKGHPYDAENTRWDKKGRGCKECNRQGAREYQRRLRRTRPA